MRELDRGKNGNERENRQARRAIRFLERTLQIHSPYLRVHPPATGAGIDTTMMRLWAADSAETLATALSTIATKPVVRVWSVAAAANVGAAETHGVVVPWQPIGASELASIVTDAEGAATRPTAGPVSASAPAPSRGRSGSRGASSARSARQRKGAALRASGT